MNQHRPRQKRSLGFEALEGRLTLSTGLAMASPHTHAVVLSRTPGKVQATFKGHTLTDGATQMIPDLTGKIGHDQFTGSGSATISNKIVQGGEVSLENSQGNIQLSLGLASVTHAGKRLRQRVPIVITQATGQYAAYAGMTGMLTSWNVPANPNKPSSFSGFVSL
jgi:hypothetical protein